MRKSKETPEERSLRLLMTLPVYRRTTSLQGPRPIIPEERREQFERNLQRLRDGLDPKEGL